MTFGEKIKELRKQKNLSRSDVAKMLGVTYWALAKYELGERSPDHALLVKFANFFDVSIDYLLGNTDIRNPIKELVQESVTGYDENYLLYKTLLSPELQSLNPEYFRLALEMQREKISIESIWKIIDVMKSVKTSSKK